MRKKLETLSNRVWSTEKSRYTAAERSRKKHQALVFAISFLSIFQVVIAISTICGFYIPFVGESKSEYLTLMASVIILVIANQDSLSKLLSHSDSYHRCANRLHRLQQAIAIELGNEAIDQEKVQDFADQYSEIIDCHDLNHLPVDYRKMISEYPDDFTTARCARNFYRLMYFINIYMLPTVYCAAPFVVVLIAKKVISN
jgi:hypothetical protein